MILSNKTNIALEYREFLILSKKSDALKPELFEKAFNEVRNQFKRIDTIMSTIKIGDRFVWEDTDGGFELSYFDLEVVQILDYDLGIVMCIEPNSFSKISKKHYISRILTVAEFQTLLATKNK